MEGGRRRGGCGGGVWLGFYFLMAATAFTAASSRSLAAMMGRPLSVRIRLASCTLVPETRRRKVTAARPGGGLNPTEHGWSPVGKAAAALLESWARAQPTAALERCWESVSRVSVSVSVLVS